MTKMSRPELQKPPQLYYDDQVRKEREKWSQVREAKLGVGGGRRLDVEIGCSLLLFHPFPQEARKYNSSSRIIEIQSEITLRAMELLALEVGRKIPTQYH